MNTSDLSKVIVGLVLLSISVPPAFSDNNNGHYGYNKHYDNGWHHNHGRKSAEHYARHNEEHAYKVSNYNNNWKWDQHNWDDQRAQMRANWQRNQADRLSREQQQQLDDQMKAQWRQYHHNNWNGQYTWDQYSDPQFLNYIHTNNPSLLTSLRERFGF